MIRTNRVFPMIKKNMEWTSGNLCYHMMLINICLCCESWAFSTSALSLFTVILFSRFFFELLSNIYDIIYQPIMHSIAARKRHRYPQTYTGRAWWFMGVLLMVNYTFFLRYSVEYGSRHGILIWFIAWYIWLYRGSMETLICSKCEYFCMIYACAKRYQSSKQNLAEKFGKKYLYQWNTRNESKRNRTYTFFMTIIRCVGVFRNSYKSSFSPLKFTRNLVFVSIEMLI